MEFWLRNFLAIHHFSAICLDDHQDYLCPNDAVQHFGTTKILDVKSHILLFHCSAVIGSVELSSKKFQ